MLLPPLSPSQEFREESTRIPIDMQVDTQIEVDTQVNVDTTILVDTQVNVDVPIPVDTQFDVKDLPSDPGIRKRLSLFDVSLQDAIRREYIQRGPCQPKSHKFPSMIICDKSTWFNDYPGWLEYSIDKDAAFCLYCYLFPSDNARGGDAFSLRGYTHWNKVKRFSLHEGGPNNAHFKASQNYQNLKNQKQDIRKVLIKQSQQEDMAYRFRLNASVDVIRFLLRQGLAFRGHREHGNSINKGNFLELLKFLGDHNEEINKVLCNAPKNNKLTHHDIQKQIVNAAAVETTNSIIQDLGETFFSILADESRDASVKEQMSIILRYVNKQGLVIERFLAIVHVSYTAATTLESAIDGILSKHNLSLSRVRGQGYDGASNMRGEFNGLKALILAENKSAHYIHCFAHQLQLTL